MTTRRLVAPAKLNLSLHVVGRRADGMHELVSELVLLELADQLLLMPGSVGLRIDGRETGGVPPAADENLAWRGLRAGAGEGTPGCLVLEKSIPAAAGLGGGSSDAAAGWLLGRATRGVGAPTPAEVAATASLGADVPFFASRAAHAEVRGIGELVTSLPSIAGWVVLAFPTARLSTAAVFAELRRSDWSAPDDGSGRNDLLGPARRLLPELDELSRRIAAAGGRPRLTGSGPTLFTVHADPDEAGAIAASLRRDGVRVLETRLRREPATIEEISDDGEEG